MTGVPSGRGLGFDAGWIWIQRTISKVQDLFPSSGPVNNLSLVHVLFELGEEDLVAL